MTTPTMIESITVKELITLLLDEPMTNTITIRDGHGYDVRGATITSKERPGLGALFG